MHRRGLTLPYTLIAGALTFFAALAGSVAVPWHHDAHRAGHVLGATASSPSSSPTTFSFSGTVGAANPAGQILNVTPNNSYFTVSASSSGWLPTPGISGTVYGGPAPTYNYLLYSEQFDSAAWVKQAGITVTANAAANPSGQLTADRLQITGVGLANRLYQTVTGLAGSNVYFGVSIKSNTTTTQTVYLQVVDNASGAVYGQAACAVSQTAYVHCLTPASISSTSTGVNLSITNLGPQNPLDVLVWGAQLDMTNGTYHVSTSTPATGTVIVPGFSVAPTTTAIGAGTFSGSIIISPASGSAFTAYALPVTLTMKALPVVTANGASVASMSFGGTSGGATQVQTITVSSSQLYYSLTPSSTPSWLSVASACGASSSYYGGLSAPLCTWTVAANPTGLASGTYGGSLTIAAANGSSFSSIVIPVTFGVAGPIVPPPAVSTTSISFAATYNGPLTAAQQLTVSSSQAFYATNIANISWLSATSTCPASSTYGGPSEPQCTWTLQGNPAGLGTSTYAATIQVSQAGGSSFTAIPVAVSMTVTSTPVPQPSIAPGSLSFSGIAGGTSSSQTLTVSSSQSFYSIRTSATSTWLSIATSTCASSSSYGGAGAPNCGFTIVANPFGLPLTTTTYTGSVTVAPANGSAFATTTVAATFAVTAPPPLAVSTSSIIFTGTAASGIVPAPKTFVITPNSQTYYVNYVGTWFGLSISTGANMGGPGSQPLTVTTTVIGANIATLASGTYGGSITVYPGTGATFATTTIPVSLVLSAPSSSIAPTVSTTSLAFAMTSGGATSTQNVTITPNGAYYALAATSTNGWMYPVVNPGTYGGPSSSPQTFAVTQNPVAKTFTPGTYGGSITVAPANGSTFATTTVPATLTVTGSSLSVSTTSISFTTPAGSSYAPAAQTVTVSPNNYYYKVAYANSPSAAFFSISASTGTVYGGSLATSSFSIYPLANQTAPAGTYTGSVTIYPANGSIFATTTIPVVTTVTPVSPTVTPTSSLQFVGYVGAGTTTPAQSFGVASNNMFYTVLTTSTWVSATSTCPASSTYGGPNQQSCSWLAWSVISASATVGTYNGFVTVAPANGSVFATTTVPLVLTVNPAPTYAPTVPITISGSSFDITAGTSSVAFGSASNTVQFSAPAGTVGYSSTNGYPTMYIQSLDATYSVTATSTGGWLSALLASAPPCNGARGTSTYMECTWFAFPSAIAGLAAGTYGGSIVISPTGTSTFATVTIPASLTITNSPAPAVSTTTIALATSSPFAYFTVTTTNAYYDVTLSSAAASWLTLEPGYCAIGVQSGNAYGPYGPCQWVVQANPSAVSAPGQYNGSIIVSAVNGSAFAPITIPIGLNAPVNLSRPGRPSRPSGPTPPTLSNFSAIQPIALTAQLGNPAVVVTTTFISSNNVTFEIDATSTGGWLVANPGGPNCNGGSGGSLCEWTFSVGDISSLAPGSYAGSVAIMPTGSSTFIGYSVPATLTVLPPPPVAFVQSNWNGAAGVTGTTTCRVGLQNIASGDFLIAGALMGSVTNTVASISDTAADRWVTIPQFTDNVHAVSELVSYVTSTAGGAVTTTITVKNTPSRWGCIVAEYANVNSANPIDATTSKFMSSTTFDSGAVIAPLAGDMVVGFGHRFNSGSVELTPGSGFAMRTATSAYYFLEDAPVTSSGSYHATATQATSSNNITAAIVLERRPPAASGTVNQPIASAPWISVALPPGGSTTTPLGVLPNGSYFSMPVGVQNGGAGWLALNGLPPSWPSPVYGGPSVTSTTATVTLNAAGLATGTYYALIGIAPAKGSAFMPPAAIPVTLTVGSPAVPTASSLAFTGVSGGASLSQTVVVNNRGDLYAVNPVSDYGWLTATPTCSGQAPFSAPCTFTVSADPSGLVPGTYSGSVIIPSGLNDAATFAPATIPVSFTVTSSTDPAVSTTSISLNANYGGTFADQTITVNPNNRYFQLVPYPYNADDGHWLSIASSSASGPVYGGLNAGPVTFTLHANAAGLAVGKPHPGEYLIYSSLDPSFSTFDEIHVPVLASVNPGASSSAPIVSSSSLWFSDADFIWPLGTPSALASNCLTISNYGSGVLNYTATAVGNPSWFTLQSGSSDSGGWSFAGRIAAAGSDNLCLFANISGLPVGTTKGTVQISGSFPGSPISIPVTVTVATAHPVTGSVSATVTPTGNVVKRIPDEPVYDLKVTSAGAAYRYHLYQDRNHDALWGVLFSTVKPGVVASSTGTARLSDEITTTVYPYVHPGTYPASVVVYPANGSYFPTVVLPLSATIAEGSTVDAHQAGTVVLGTDGIYYWLNAPGRNVVPPGGFPPPSLSSVIAPTEKDPFPGIGNYLSYQISEGSVPLASAADMALPTGSPVPPANGTLVNESGTTYIAIGGTKRAFTTIDSAYKAGFNFNQIYVNAKVSSMTTGAAIANDDGEAAALNYGVTRRLANFRVVPVASSSKAMALWGTKANPQTALFDENGIVNNVTTTRPDCVPSEYVEGSVNTSTRLQSEVLTLHCTDDNGNGALVSKTNIYDYTGSASGSLALQMTTRAPVIFSKAPAHFNSTSTAVAFGKSLPPSPIAMLRGRLQGELALNFIHGMLNPYASPLAQTTPVPAPSTPVPPSSPTLYWINSGTMNVYDTTNVPFFRWNFTNLNDAYVASANAGHAAASAVYAQTGDMSAAGDAFVKAVGSYWAGLQSQQSSYDSGVVFQKITGESGNSYEVVDVEGTLEKGGGIVCIECSIGASTVVQREGAVWGITDASEVLGYSMRPVTDQVTAGGGHVIMQYTKADGSVAYYDVRNDGYLVPSGEDDLLVYRNPDGTLAKATFRIDQKADVVDTEFDPSASASDMGGAVRQFVLESDKAEQEEAWNNFLDIGGSVAEEKGVPVSGSAAPGETPAVEVNVADPASPGVAALESQASPEVVFPELAAQNHAAMESLGDGIAGPLTTFNAALTELPVIMAAADVGNQSQANVAEAKILDCLQIIPDCAKGLDYLTGPEAFTSVVKMAGTSVNDPAPTQGGFVSAANNILSAMGVVADGLMSGTMKTQLETDGINETVTMDPASEKRLDMYLDQAKADMASGASDIGSAAKSEVGGVMVLLSANGLTFYDANGNPVISTPDAQAAVQNAVMQVATGNLSPTPTAPPVAVYSFEKPQTIVYPDVHVTQEFLPGGEAINKDGNGNIVGGSIPIGVIKGDTITLMTPTAPDIAGLSADQVIYDNWNHGSPEAIRTGSGKSVEVTMPSGAVLSLGFDANGNVGLVGNQQTISVSGGAGGKVQTIPAVIPYEEIPVTNDTVQAAVSSPESPTGPVLSPLTCDTGNGITCSVDDPNGGMDTISFSADGTLNDIFGWNPASGNFGGLISTENFDSTTNAYDLQPTGGTDPTYVDTYVPGFTDPSSGQPAPWAGDGSWQFGP
ncbi:MAG TPA: hypothetical protein VMT99_01485 [Candidatus Paceibacterota bacterium]|nr:hypothetical protein [Candidatus Paceibacterota bacterium]